MIKLHPDLAFEYLDDGGILICQLDQGDYWQLSSPAGDIWAWIWESREFGAVSSRLSEQLSVGPEEAEAALRSLCDQLVERGIVLDYRPAAE